MHRLTNYIRTILWAWFCCHCPDMSFMEMKILQVEHFLDVQEGCLCEAGKLCFCPWQLVQVENKFCSTGYVCTVKKEISQLSYSWWTPCAPCHASSSKYQCFRFGRPTTITLSGLPWILTTLNWLRSEGYCPMTFAGRNFQIIRARNMKWTSS